MNKLNWSSEKEELFKFNQNICVRAGAGSGKTAALVELNSRFLSNDTSLENVVIDEILAVTFTEKAAGEIKNRIKDMIEGHLAENKDDFSENWLSARKGLFRANISTFHSFCTRILHEHPIEAKISPAVQIITDLETEELLSIAAEKTILDSFSEGEEITELLNSIGFRSLCQTLITTLKSLRSAGKEVSKIMDSYLEAEKECEKAFIKDAAALPDLLNEFKEQCEYEIATGKKGKISSNYENIKENFDELYTRKALTVEPARELLELIDSIRKLIKGQTTKNLKEIKNELAETLNNLELETRFIVTKEKQYFVTGLLNNFSQKYSDIKKEKAMLDFDDLIYFTRDLLKNNKEIRKKYKNKFRVVLVDEFQDTNELQREIVYLLGENLAGERDYKQCEDIDLEERKLFIVGDAKQSIYRFRGADVSVFSKVIEDVRRKKGGLVIFRENFRTLKPILDVLNPFFSKILKEKEYDYQTGFSEEDLLEASRKALFCDLPAVEILPIFKNKNAQQRRSNEADYIARRILEITETLEIHSDEGSRKASFKDIALLMRKTTASQIYLNALQKYNIPYVFSGGSGFYALNEVRDLACALSFISGINPDLSLAALLRSPLCALTDSSIALLAINAKNQGLAEFFINLTTPEHYLTDKIDIDKLKSFKKIIFSLMKYRDIISAQELLIKICDAFNFKTLLKLSYNGEQKAANVEKLIAKARETSHTSAAFVRFLNKMQEDEVREGEAEINSPQADAVKIMTIHKAKGLEFPIVIVPDLSGRKNSPEDYNIYSSAEKGIALRFKDTGRSSEDTWLSRHIKEDSDLREEAESRRLLYVALTRARDYLILTLAIEEKERKNNVGKKDWNTMFLDFLNCEDDVRAFIENEEKEEIVKQISTELGAFLIKFRKPSVKSPFQQPVIQTQALTPTKEQEIINSAQTALRNFTYTAEELSLTPTSIITYSICPRKFLYDSFRSSSEGLYRVSRTSPTAKPDQETGWAAHYILERLNFSNDVKTFGSQIKAIVAELRKDNPFFNRSDLDWAQKAVEKFSQIPSELKHVYHPDNTFHKEYEIFYQFREKIWINGIMDLAVETPCGKIIVVDYKYGKSGIEKQIKYEKQIYTYLIGLLKSSQIDKTEAYLLFLTPQQTEISVIDTSFPKISEFEKELEQMCVNIMKKNKFSEEEWEKRNTDVLCRKIECPYLQRCF